MAELETHHLMHNQHILARIHDVSINLRACAVAGAWLPPGVDVRSTCCMGAVRQGRS